MDIKLFCPAKINLFLEVLDKREDSYHELDTVMMSVNLCDTVSLDLRQSSGTGNNIRLKCPCEGVPEDESNIAWKAALAFFERFEISGYDLLIDIDKKIPVAAGLAGGSADCAGVLLGLENLFNMQDRHDELLNLGASLGADVPFCMTCGCAHASGIGDIMTKLPAITPEWTFVIAKGGQGVSTREAYAEIDARSAERRSSNDLIKCLEGADVAGVCSNLYNAFEGVVEPKREAVGYAKTVMTENGCLGCLMSGSGPSVFGIFADADGAENARDILDKAGYSAHICFPVM